MTTSTRKMTRRTPWAAVITAVISVLALVFGALAFAGVASAKDNPNRPDDPGKSAQAPGQNNTPPGQQPGDTPGSSHDKMTICHKVEGTWEHR